MIKNYQAEAARTLIDRPGFEISDRDIMLIWNAIGLGGETDELTDLFSVSNPSRAELLKELGDCYWYAAALSTKLEIEFTTLLRPYAVQIQFESIGEAIAKVNGYCGRVTEYFKKGIFHQHGVDVAKASQLLCKYLTILTAFASHLGFNLDEILEANITRLRDRYPEGFSVEASINRSDP